MRAAAGRKPAASFRGGCLRTARDRVAQELRDKQRQVATRNQLIAVHVRAAAKRTHDWPAQQAGNESGHVGAVDRRIAVHIARTRLTNRLTELSFVGTHVDDRGGAARPRRLRTVRPAGNRRSTMRKPMRNEPNRAIASFEWRRPARARLSTVRKKSARSSRVALSWSSRRTARSPRIVPRAAAAPAACRSLSRPTSTNPPVPKRREKSPRGPDTSPR